MSKNYGQFCGLAKAAWVLGERWALLLVRDLSIAPRRFDLSRFGSDISSGSAAASDMQSVRIMAGLNMLAADSMLDARYCFD